MNSNDASQMLPRPLSEQTAPQSSELCLKVRGCKNLVSFKNSKMMLPAKGNRKAMLITAPEKQKAMKSYEDALLFALSFAYQTSATGTRTGCSPLSWILSSVPEDDSWKYIPKSEGYECIEVPDGQEGADIYITPLD